jgi:hypothetical protein
MHQLTLFNLPKPWTKYTIKRNGKAAPAWFVNGAFIGAFGVIDWQGVEIIGELKTLQGAN